MNYPKVSIIVPVYNVEKYLVRCMDSLLNQTLKDIEIIVIVERECTDNCVAICKEYSKMDSRIILIVNDKKGGLAKGRNVGIPYITGEYCAFVDSDDYVELEMYNLLYTKAKESQANVIFCGHKREKKKRQYEIERDLSQETIFEGRQEIDLLALDFVASEPSDRIERKYEMSVWHSLYSAEMLKRYNIAFYDEQNIPTEDLPFQVDILRHSSKVLFVPDCLYIYCNNENSLSKDISINLYNKFRIVYEQINEKIQDIDEHHCRVNRFYIGYARCSIIYVVRSNQTKKEKFEYIKNVCNDGMWSNIRRNYPMKEMPLFHEIMYYLVLKHYHYLIYVYARIYTLFTPK
jgi:glycosyltransferase involved in cell wall biosynthesis